ncbi:MAG: MarR family transcriptional regulator [Ruminococcaceae bacterium]|nr:MarR family transcriptional regulator [Oscillospiraceae bacterium]
MTAMFRFRKVGITFSADCAFQFVELSVMKRITASCPAEGKNLNVSEIQDTLHISKSAVSQTLSSLEKKGYITREIDKNDRRKIAVAATPEGKRVLREALCSYDRLLSAMVERYGAENLDQLIEKVNELSDVYEAVKMELRSETA